MLQHPIIKFTLYYLSSGLFREDTETKENFNRLGLKVIVLTYEDGRLQEVQNIVI